MCRGRHTRAPATTSRRRLHSTRSRELAGRLRMRPVAGPPAAPSAALPAAWRSDRTPGVASSLSLSLSPPRVYRGYRALYVLLSSGMERRGAHFPATRYGHAHRRARSVVSLAKDRNIIASRCRQSFGRGEGSLALAAPPHRCAIYFRFVGRGGGEGGSECPSSVLVCAATWGERES